MSLFKLLPSEIPDNNPRISVGLVIRNVTVYLNDEFVRVIKEKQKNTLQNLVKEFYSTIKKLHKFIKNVKFFEKMSKIDKLTMILYEFNSKVIESVNQLYYTHEMCKFLRIPSFNLIQTSKVINDTAHKELRKKIAASIPITNDNREKLIYFLEKNYYSENIHLDEVNQTISKMRNEMIFSLNLPTLLLKLKDFENKEFVSLKNDIFEFKFGDVCFNIFPFTFKLEDSKDMFTYFCKDVLCSDSRNYFFESIELMKKNLPYLNNLIYANIQIEIFDDNQDMLLTNLQNILKGFKAKYLHRSVFKNIYKDFVKNQSKFNYKVKTGSANNFSLVINYDCFNQEEFTINIKLESDFENLDYFVVKYSHFLINENPLVLLKESRNIFKFSTLKKFEFEQCINQKIKDFSLINLRIIHDKVKNIKSFFIPFKIICENTKISFTYEGFSVLFSIIVDSKGRLKISDDKFLFNNMIDNQILLDYVKEFLSNTISDDRLFLFNEYVFKKFILQYFKISHFHLIYSRKNLQAEGFNLKFFIFENRNLDRTILIDIPILSIRPLKYDLIQCHVMNGTSKEQDSPVLSFPFNDHKINLINKNNFDLNTLNDISNYLSSVQKGYSEYFKNILESLTFFTFTKTNLLNIDRILIDIDNLVAFNESLSIEIEILDSIKFYIKEIFINNSNLVLKILLNEDNLKSKFPKFNNFSVMDTDNIINFSLEDFSINFYFLTKTNIRSIGDVNYLKRFFTKILIKLINFIKKQSFILNQNEMKTVLSQSENVIVSPIGYQFKYDFFGGYSKTIYVHFSNIRENDKRNLKCHILPLEYQNQNIYSFDVMNKLLLDCDVGSFYNNLINHLFFSYIYSILSKRFSSFVFPIASNFYDSMSLNDKIFVFVRDNKTFHIIKQNKLSLFVEIMSPCKINLFSSYLWNSENCLKFMNSIVQKEDIESVCSTNTYATRKLVILSNNTSSIIKDLNLIFDYINSF